MAAADTDRVDQLRREFHAVATDVAVLKSQLSDHRTQSALQHDAVMAAVAELRGDLSDQGKAPVPADPLAVTLSPEKLLPWLKVLVPILAALGVGGGLGQALDHALDPPAAPAPPSAAP